MSVCENLRSARRDSVTPESRVDDRGVRPASAVDR
jgi:hypothetical protein